MSEKTLTIAGAGTIGSQIAFQAAMYQINVKIFDLDPAAAKKNIAAVSQMFQQALRLSDAEIAAGRKQVKIITNDWQEAFKTDFVIEAISENIAVKRAFYDKLSHYLDEKVIVASNSSTIMPSQLAGYIEHPERFLHMHFANHIWHFNAAEIVGTEETKAEYKRAAVSLAKEMGMVPIQLNKENPGYIMNALSIPLLNAALKLWAKDVADPQTIDQDWKISSGMPIGPFRSLDMIGLRTAYAIESKQSPKTPSTQLICDKLQEMIAAGKTGELAGEGFYKY